MVSKKKMSGQKTLTKRRRVTVNFEAPHAESVLLMGDFNQWNEKKHPMKQGENGMWEKVIVVQPTDSAAAAAYTLIQELSGQR